MISLKLLFTLGNCIFFSCTSITGTPTMYVDILSKVKTMGDIPSKLRMALAAGAPCSPQLIKDMQKYLKADVKVCLFT